MVYTQRRRRSTDDDWQQLAESLMFKDEKHMFETFYVEEGLSVNEIAERLNVGTATVNRRMSAYNINKRPRGGPRKTADKRSILFYLDQRVVMAMPNKLLSEVYGMSYSVVYQYKRWKAGGSFIGYNLSATGRQISMEGIRR